MIAADNDRGGARLGMAVARRTAGNAVARNRLKRLIRETFRTMAGTLPALDVVVTAAPAAKLATNAALRASLIEHWQRLMKRCESS
jgi:ribonuclease P protein component